MSEWETFCDECYYHLWRVRRKSERGFNDGFHLQHGEEARALVELLNRFERERDEAMEVYESNRITLHEVIAKGVKVERERDEARKQLTVFKAERDYARLQARQSDEAHDRVIGDLERADVMADKAKELIARWDQPSWKDTAPTAGFIYALRDAVSAYEKKPE